MASPVEREDRVLVLTPSGRDATLAAGALAHAAIPHVICLGVAELCEGIDEGAGAAVIASEALGHSAIARVRASLDAQPAWSDLPLIVLTPPGGSTERSRRMFELLVRLGNVTTLERPMHAVGLIVTLRAALRARRRQYEIRDLLAQLEDAVQQRERFLAILGHELRNPLSAIRNAVQLAQLRADRTPDLGRSLAMIHRQSRVLDRLVDDLLDVARVTSGKIVLQREVVDVSAVARQAVEQQEPAFRQRGVRLACEPAQQQLPVSADPERLEQVLTNLLTNACKYTPAGGSVIVRVAREGGRARVTVQDDGIGIPRELLPTIFDLFAQADASLDRAQGGLGIGLTLARSIAEMHGGSLQAASDGPGRGSVFILRLPLAAGGVRDAEAAPVAPGERARRAILLIEDNTDSRESLSELLELVGHEVRAAADGPEGLRLAAERRPDVAIVDVGLPGLSGYEVARRLRASLGDSVRLIALTGYGQPEDRRRALDAGFDAHVTKPVDIDELDRTIACASRSGALGVEQSGVGMGSAPDE
jgi:signal transduction histidine kinase/CheY-like chemotaxis protein